MNISTFFQAAPNVFLFKHAPVAFCSRYLQVLGTLYYLANRAEREQIKNNILSVFKNSGEARSIIERTFAGIYSHYSEKLIMAHRNFAVLQKELCRVLEYSGLTHLDSALEQGGVVLATGHFGGVEFMPLALALRRYQVTMVAAFQTERLRKSLMERAADVDVELIDAQSDNVAQQAMQALNRGRILLSLCDEVDAWRTREQRTTQAFGGEVWLDRSLEVLCRRTNSTMLGSFMIRTGRGYCLTIVPLDDTERPAEQNLSAEILKTFEQFVLRYPDQWYQWKKFHKMRPESACR